MHTAAHDAFWTTNTFWVFEPPIRDYLGLGKLVLDRDIRLIRHFVICFGRNGGEFGVDIKLKRIKTVGHLCQSPQSTGVERYDTSQRRFFARGSELDRP